MLLFSPNLHFLWITDTVQLRAAVKSQSSFMHLLFKFELQFTAVNRIKGNLKNFCTVCAHLNYYECK